ncbi:hypothetical protein GYB29_01300 [bacterium]|jgi:hypothetical protein|nr:hypothetical protein [bacterium]
MTEIFPYLFGVLFCSVIGWFFLVYTLFKILRIRHPEKYRDMGSPTLFPQEQVDLGGLKVFNSFLFKREWRELNDTKLASLGWFMICYITLYVIGFLFLITLLFLGYAP